ncbi:MAG TPA: DUF1285 domain-containing protein [Stellaceae bacterium]|nr:DUF1285 domain-containing protein [Stellaceae bacterium]
MSEQVPSAEELRRLAAAARADRASNRPPPHDLGDIAIHIAQDGSWFYRGTPITRMSLVRLFASVLRRESDGSYWLVSPAERGRITVEDVPFLAVELMVTGVQGTHQSLSFRTNLDEIVAADGTHPLRVATDTQTGTPRPYLLVRDGLEARLTRPVFYELVDLASEEDMGGMTRFGVWSNQHFFPLGDLR